MLDVDTLLELVKPGPRYTSYPTVPRWSADLGDAALDQALRDVRGPVSVYVHVPFCAEQCRYCGCNMVVARRQAAGDRYLDALERRIDALPLPAERVAVTRVHLGGGTPTWLTPRQLERLYALLWRRFSPLPGAELSVEADPSVTSLETLRALAAQGVGRLSFGIQSFDPVVLEAVRRPQCADHVAALMAHARALGVGSINLDLMYGLPHQTPERFTRTLERALALQPERLAVFGYAHVPWMKAHQRELDADHLPDLRERATLQRIAHLVLAGAGYTPIGLDHYAAPDDALARAYAERRLHRNFMGYTTQPGVAVIGLGMSAISEVGDVYAQARPKLAGWYRAVERGEPLVARGHVLSREDRLRRAAINALMCNLSLDLEALAARWGEGAVAQLAPSVAALQPLVERELVAYDGRMIEVTENARPLIRQVAAAFDPAMVASLGARHSQGV